MKFSIFFLQLKPPRQATLGALSVSSSLSPRTSCAAVPTRVRYTAGQRRRVLPLGRSWPLGLQRVRVFSACGHSSQKGLSAATLSKPVVGAVGEQSLAGLQSKAASSPHVPSPQGPEWLHSFSVGFAVWSGKQTPWQLLLPPQQVGRCKCPPSPVLTSAPAPVARRRGKSAAVFRVSHSLPALVYLRA